MKALTIRTLAKLIGNCRLLFQEYYIVGFLCGIYNIQKEHSLKEN